MDEGTNDRRGVSETSVNRRDFVRAAGYAAAGVALGGRLETSGATQAPVRIKNFIPDVKQARLFDLSLTWDENSPIASVNPPFSMVLNNTHASTIGSFDGHLSFTSEIMQWSGQHGAPSIDAIGH